MKLKSSLTNFWEWAFGSGKLCECGICEKIKVLRRAGHSGGMAIETEEEMRILEKYALTGWVHFGCDFYNNKARAFLTPHGKWLLSYLGVPCGEGAISLLLNWSGYANPNAAH